ncbi:glycogen synthase GlgA [Paenibacillus thermoaerophilus]|uniref:Glycogen synthase n=1 Tax=Paenibacillus thermoaerophilus TaxID=1215385 RepID=A0ABW2V135_9BACL|nr:glycogen synthase GlgA [Paenibacillus thermoaerophilus]TMV07397.1 glycogen synthase GlgA [Paenibacillus thermoaerophilus]
MKVLFAASEAAPFAKTGGLGDVVGALPKELRKLGVDARVILPKYGLIAEEWTSRMETLRTWEVSVGWRNQYCGIQTLEHDGVPVYFIDNEYYFKRGGLYGYGDEAERFAFFSRAVVEALAHLDFGPDIVHAHDWQTALVPVLLNAHYRPYAPFRRVRTVFTIHNLKYQGVFSREVLQDVTGLGDDYMTPDRLEYYGAANCMKGGLLEADILTTVSPTYAEEIQRHFGEGLDGVLRARSGALHGIVNGIDTDSYDPMTDPQLVSKFRSSLTAKRRNKTALQAELGLPLREDVPMIAIVSRLVEQKGLDLIGFVLEELLAENIQLVVLGTGEGRYEEMFRSAAARHPEKVSANIVFDDGLARRIYAASDLFLMPSLFEPCGIGQLLAFRYRSVPIVRETGGLKDTVQAYDPTKGEGTGFTFQSYNAHDMLHAVRRALSCYGRSEQWNKIAANIAKVDVGWSRSAKQYVKLYRKLLSGGRDDPDAADGSADIRGELASAK